MSVTAHSGFTQCFPFRSLLQLRQWKRQMLLLLNMNKTMLHCCRVNKFRPTRTAPCTQQIKYLMTGVVAALDTLAHSYGLYLAMAASLWSWVKPCMRSHRGFGLSLCANCYRMVPGQKTNSVQTSCWTDHVAPMLRPVIRILTMFLCCCFFSRDCGGSGKRKSGKDVVCFLMPTWMILWVLKVLYNSFHC